MHKELYNINLPLRGFVRRFNVSSLKEFSLCGKRQYSYNETDALKLRGNREMNFDGAVSSSFKTTFFSECELLIFDRSSVKKFADGLFYFNV